MHHRGTEDTEVSVNELTEKIIGAAIAVHRELGPGLLESAYEACLAHELSFRRVGFKKQVEVPIRYKAVTLDCGYRLDFMVDQRVIIEVKAVERILPIHEAQLLTYLRLSRVKWGLLLNFCAPVLKQGIRRMAN